MFLINIAFGANLFIIIVAILIGAGVGLSTTDFLKTKAREKEWERNQTDQDSTDI